jgi:hypothetical protein
MKDKNERPSAGEIANTAVAMTVAVTAGLAVGVVRGFYLGYTQHTDQGRQVVQTTGDAIERASAPIEEVFETRDARKHAPKPEPAAPTPEQVVPA